MRALTWLDIATYRDVRYPTGAALLLQLPELTYLRMFIPPEAVHLVEFAKRHRPHLTIAWR